MASLGQLFFLGSRLLLVPHQRLCGLLFCPGFSGTTFVSLGSQLLWVLHTFVCYRALLSRPLWDSLLRARFIRVNSTLFSRSLGLCDFDAPLDSVALTSLIECISRALAIAASRLLWETFCFIRVPTSLCPSSSLACFCLSVLASLGHLIFFWDPASLGPSQQIVCFCFSVLAYLGQLIIFMRPGFSRSLPIPCVLFAFLSWLLQDSFCFFRIPASLGPSTLLVCFCFSVLASLG